MTAKPGQYFLDESVRSPHTGACGSSNVGQSTPVAGKPSAHCAAQPTDNIEGHRPARAPCRFKKISSRVDGSLRRKPASVSVEKLHVLLLVHRRVVCACSCVVPLMYARGALSVLARALRLSCMHALRIERGRSRPPVPSLCTPLGGVHVCRAGCLRVPCDKNPCAARFRGDPLARFHVLGRGFL